ncbi:KAP family P-loop NTPase fold protein [Photobacterium sanguinicancri]|uniref:KAP family P-loop NTPase fold protein n=1 Tax=Photobacterium sanguinicancri TaxID=875932 RepID=UPI0021C3C691|nr:KAP family NTPase [Photobacterium sanguinicancri]
MGFSKTYFLRRWAEDLKKHYPAVYVDAWKQDYSDDPLMTVISSMIKQLREQAGKDADKAVFKAPRKLVGLLKAAAPSVVGGLTKRYLGIDPVAIMNAADDGEVGEVLDENGEPLKDENGKPIDMGAAASKMVKHLIDEHDAKASTIESLKKNVEQWVEAVVGKDQEKKEDELKRTYPAFVFIDELDRCRPSYAVEMLETIKHIFDIPGVVFVVATDTEQLQHAVKAIYGDGFEARVYLGRFFNSRYTLKESTFKNLLPVHCDISRLTPSALESRGIVYWPKVENDDDAISNITNIYEGFSLSARQAIQITERLIITLGSFVKGEYVNICYLCVLLCIREKDVSVFSGIIKKDLPDNNHHLDQNYQSLMSLLDNKRQISFYVEPKELIQDFSSHCRVSNNNRSINRYQDAKYDISIMAFLRQVHGHYICGKSKNLEQSVKALYDEQERNSGNIGANKASHWANVSCGLENEEYKHTTYLYKDLVELASAIDWIDGEDEA